MFLTLALSIVLSIATAWAQRTDMPQQDLGLVVATHFGTGDCSAATLNAALSSIGPTATTLLVPPVPRNSVTPCTWNLSTGVTVPRTTTLKIPHGVVLTPAASITLTLASCPEAGDYQIFNANGTSTGVVTLACGEVWPEWWGANAADATDDTGTVQAAETALETTGGKIKFKQGTYRLTTVLLTAENLTLEGTGEGTILLGTDNTKQGILDGTNAHGLKIRNLQMDRTWTSVTVGPTDRLGQGINCEGCNDVLIENNLFTGTPLRFIQSDRLDIRSNRLDYDSSTGQLYATLVRASNNTWVDGNVCIGGWNEDCFKISAYQEGALVGQYVKLTNNTCDGQSDECIDTFSNGQRVIISGTLARNGGKMFEY